VQGLSKKAEHWALKFDDGKVLPKLLAQIKIPRNTIQTQKSTAVSDDLYTCEYDCGFKGIFDAVERHEKICKARK
jgi:hypothetical protein